jgi:hypothetical protein
MLAANAPRWREAPVIVFCSLPLILGMLVLTCPLQEVMNQNKKIAGNWKYG